MFEFSKCLYIYTAHGSYVVSDITMNLLRRLNYMMCKKIEISWFDWRLNNRQTIKKLIDENENHMYM